ncbi:MAG: MFS transporter [Ureaplasma sp.]|nr:MFS transporter [Ureaplasma sp.]
MNDAILIQEHLKGLPLGTLLGTIVLTGYGFVGVFARIFADYFSYLFKYRKAFLYLAVIINIATFIPIIAIQNPITSIVQVIGVGISASCIGTVELLFRSQYDEKKSFLTVSILSIPPLLANFITAPIQSVIASYAKVGNVVVPERLSYLWIVGLICLVACLIILFFIKEKKLIIIKPLINNSNRNIFKMNTVKPKYSKISETITYFIIISLIGTIVAFIKFSNSGAIGISHLNTLSNGSSASYEGYLSVIFSLAQLAAGILMGMVLIKKWKPIYILLLGCSSWLIYLTCTSFIRNPIAFFVIHSLNGFAYGIIYNLLLGLILVVSINTVKITSMGIYQSILSIGIACSGWFNSYMKNSVFNNEDKNLYFKNNIIVNVVLISSVIILFLTYLIMSLYFKKNNKEFYNQHFIATVSYKQLTLPTILRV